ncbi:unnamed protein product [Closterium sp. NIES-54]
MLLAPEGDPDALDIPTPRSYAEAIEDEVPPPGANIVSGMWILRVKQPPGSPPAFKARYVARGFSQRQGVDFFQTFSPSPKMTTLWVLLHVAAQRNYELHSLDFSTAFLQGSLHEEIWLRCPPGFTGLFPAGTQWSLRRPVYSLHQAPHDLVFATADTEALAHVKSELQKRHTCTDLGHSLSAPPLDESVEPSGPYPELVGCLMPTAVLDAMVDPVVQASVVDTLEARLENARRRHEANEYGDLPGWLSRLTSELFYAGQDFCHPPAGRSTQHSHMEGSHQTTAGDGRADGLRRWHRGDAVGKLLQPACRVFVVQLLTFTAISRCCSPGVRIALKPCRDYLDAGLQAWHFIESTYQVADDLYIGQLEEHMTYLRMGDQETATDYYNWALRLLATMRMSGVQYSTASYVTHVLKGLPSNYNVMKRLSVVPSTQATLNEDPLTSYILWDEAMQEAKHEPDDNEAKGGRGRSASRRPCRGNWPRKEKQSNKSTSAKDADSLTGGKGRDNKEASCSLVGVVEPTISLVPEAGEDFQAMAAAVQSNRAVVLLDSGCSHHLMGTKEVFVDLQPSGNVKHVRGFNGVLQDVQGRGTVALQGEGGKQVLILDVLYVSGVHVNLLLAGQLKENGVKLKEDGDRILFVTSAGDILGRASYTGRVLCTDVRPCSAKSASPKTEVVALQAIVSATKSTSDRLHARLALVSMDTIQSLAKHEVATGLELKSASGADSPCVSCVGGKLVRHTFGSFLRAATLGACVVSIPGTSEGLCVGAAATTSLAPAFVDGSGATSQTAQLSFTLDSGASSCFFRDCTDLTPPRTPVTIALANPFVGPVVARSTTTIPCPAAPSGFLTGYYTPSFSRNLERYFLTVVDDYSHYTTVFHLRRKADVPTVLELWLLAWGGAQGLCQLCLHSDRGGVAADFRVWGSLAHFRARGAKKLSPRTRDCIFLGFPLDASGWVFYDSVTYQIFASQDVTFDESVYYYRRRPHRAPLPFASCLVRCVARRSAVVPPPQHPVPVVSGGAGGAVAEGEGTGAAGADGVGSGFAGVVGVEFPPCSSLRPVAAEPGGVSVGGTGGPKGVSGVGAGSGGARAGGTGTVAPALCSELPWLSFLLTDLGERPRSPPVSFADNTSAVLLCEEPRLRGGKPKPKDRWGLHLSVSEESKGWELLDIADNWVVTTSNVVFYKTMSLEVWKAEQGPALGRTQVDQPTDTLTATLPLLAEVGAIADADAEGVHHPSVAPPFVADLRGLTPVSASSDEGRSGVSPVVPAKSIAGGRRDAVKIGVGTKLMPTREQQAEEVQPTLVKPAGLQSTREQAAVKPTKEQSATGQSVGELTTGEKSAGTQTDVQWNDEGSEAGFFFGNASYTITAHTSINSRNCS